MDTTYMIASIYVVAAFLRIIYNLATGFLYSTPKVDSWLVESYQPLVSIIIPAWNESVGIERTVASILANTYTKVEIIAVDDGSTDNTAAIVQQITRWHPQTVKLISKPNGGKSSALNAGIAQADGSLILTVDADSYLESDSIARLVAAMANPVIGVAIGEVVVGNFKSLLGRTQHFEYSIGFHIKRAQYLFNSIYIFPGAFTMFRRSLFYEVGGFTDYSSTEDLDISMRIKMAGHKVAYVDSAMCVTEGAPTVEGLLNQRTRWRHGYLECLLHNMRFIFSPRKGNYLTFIDLPIQLFGIVEILLFPVLISFIAYLISLSPNPWVPIASLMLLPLTLLMLGDLRRTYRQISLWVFAMPFMLTFVGFIEHIALLRALARTILRKRTAWTVWQRTGAIN